MSFYLKRKRGEEQPEEQPTVVVCLMDIGSIPDSVSYSFESLSFGSLINPSSSQKQLKHEFTWSKDSAVFPCYRGMSFAKVGNSLYVVGGVRCDEKPNHFYCVDVLPRELSCISLTSPLQNSEAKYNCPMWGRKLFLAVEIDGLVYVLSVSSPYIKPASFDTVFEVYDPSMDEWTRLETPPFLGKGSRCFTRRYFGAYSYVVIGNKLCVSTRDFSCAYDIKNKKWEACDLFLDFQFESFGLVISPDEIYVPPPTEGCGPPFPFLGRAILYESDILLCIIPFMDRQVVAIQMDGEKALRMIPFLDCMPPGDVDNLIDLGRGYFSAVLLTDEWEKCGDLTFFTFKLSRSGQAGAVSCGHVRTSTWKVRKQGRPSPIPVYSFTL